MLLADEDPCELIPGAAGSHCEEGTTGGGGGGSPADDVLNTLDPLSQLAKEVATAANWTAEQLGKVVADRSTVDFTNNNFLQQYAVVFAASTILVLVVWLLAVAKRAVRGVPMSTAVGEAIGLLWLAVGAAAFTPLVLFVLVGAVSAVTDALVAGLGSTPGGLFVSMGADLKAGKVGGGPIIQIVVSLATIALCGALWLLLVLRALVLYVGALLGVVVYAGLVDRDLWGHVRRWAALMLGIVLIEPIIVIVLGLASTLQSADDHGSVVTGLVVSLCALGAAIVMVKKFPGFGDSIRVARAAGRVAGGAARTVTGSAGAAGAAVGVQRGIAAHSGRGDAPRNGTPTPKASNPLSGGIGAHGSRNPKPPKPPNDKKD